VTISIHRGVTTGASAGATTLVTASSISRARLCVLATKR
jgi:hypothetical protein